MDNYYSWGFSVNRVVGNRNFILNIFITLYWTRVDTLVACF